MKMKLLLSLLLLSLSHCLYADEGEGDDNEVFDTEVELTCSKIDDQKTCPEIHRAPAKAPVVYLNVTQRTLRFESPCYGVELQIADCIDNENVEYSVIIPDGDTEVSLPSYLSGQYEIRIIRGAFCYAGSISL